MFADLPINLQNRVKLLLENDDFLAAKALHDAWMQGQRGNQAPLPRANPDNSA
tara:strand:- start:124159 stop:124317 length:159 start_codon:yes stop_codon:yes gene_type:complete